MTFPHQARELFIGLALGAACWSIVLHSAGKFGLGASAFTQVSLQSLAFRLALMFLLAITIQQVVFFFRNRLEATHAALLTAGLGVSPAIATIALRPSPLQLLQAADNTGLNFFGVFFVSVLLVLGSGPWAGFGAIAGALLADGSFDGFSHATSSIDFEEKPVLLMFPHTKESRKSPLPIFAFAIASVVAWKLLEEGRRRFKQPEPEGQENNHGKQRPFLNE